MYIVLIIIDAAAHHHRSRAPVRTQPGHGFERTRGKISRRTRLTTIVIQGLYVFMGLLCGDVAGALVYFGKMTNVLWRIAETSDPRKPRAETIRNPGSQNSRDATC